MIKATNSIKGKINTTQNLKGKTNASTVKVYPELEDLTVTSSTEEQHFKSEKYGYNNVTVKAVESEELSIIPSAEEQTREGIFNKITVAGDSDLVPENIKEGTEIFGVQGVAKTTSAKITDARYLFYNGARTDYLNKFLLLCENVKSCDSMFYNCNKLTDLDLSKFDTSQVTNMNDMFNSCGSLTSLDVSNFDTSKVTITYNMFYGCRSLTDLDVSNFDTSNLKSCGGMFGACNSLTSLDLSNFDISKVNTITYMFYNCTKLVDFKFGINLGKSFTQKINNYPNYKLDLSDSKLLTHDSLMSVINNLYDLNLTYDVANGGTLYRQSLVLGSTNLAKLTEEEIAIATSKGWNVT